MTTQRKASLILEGASFYPGRGLDNQVDFIALSGNRILALGTRDSMDPYIDDKTRILSFSKENLIMAGLHDNHVHLIQAGILEKYIQLYDAVSQEDAARRVAEYAKTIPDEAWILGVGFHMPSWKDPSLPVKECLDALIPDRPVFLMDEELHTAWLNSRGLAE